MAVEKASSGPAAAGRSTSCLVEVATNGTPRVLLWHGGTSHRIELHNVDGIAAALGPRVLAAFYKCFMGVERILFFENLMYLNLRARQRGDEWILDEIAFDRNGMILGMMLAGAMYEVGTALQELCATGIVPKMKNRKTWEPLDKLRAEWHTEKYAAMIRNGFAYHLGEQEHYVSGIESTPTGPTVLFEANSTRRHSGRYRATWDALLRGHGVQVSEMTAFVEKTAKAHRDYPDKLFAFFYAACQQHGIIVDDNGFDRGVARAERARAEGAMRNLEQRASATRAPAERRTKRKAERRRRQLGRRR